MSSPAALEVDVAIIGSGPGGYVCAIRLGQLGKTVALVEKEKIGGVCLNVGCIPSKALITASKLVKNARNAGKMGINAEVSVDFAKLQQWKQSVVERLTSGVSMLCKANKVQVIYGSAKIESNDVILVSNPNSPESRIHCKDIVIATGTSSIELPNLKFDGKRIITSTEALALAQPPKKMLIVGGGVIGLEIGMAYSNLFGTQLIIVELLDQLLPGTDIELVNVLTRNLQKMGAKIYLKSKVKSASVLEDGVEVTFETPDGKELKEKVDHVLVSVGRKPNSKDLGLEKVGAKLSDKGFLIVDKQMKTNVPHVYGIGDVVGGPLLAHKASREGIIAAEVISGMKSSFDSVAMPSAIFTDPEISIVGLNPIEARNKGLDTVTGKFPFAANGRALASPESDGFVKMIADKDSGLLLGVEIVGGESSDLISEATLAIEKMGATIEDIALTIHTHPTLPEAMMEAAENALGRAIHIQNSKSQTAPH